MQYNPEIFHRRSIRLKEYDYSQSGAYFITISTHHHEPLFGQIGNGIIYLNHAGNIVKKCWMDIPIHFPHSKIDQFVIMPNHVHGIIIIEWPDIVGANNYSPLRNVHISHRQHNGTSKTIGSIVRGFKIGVTKWFHKNTDIHIPWQRNYYEHIICNENELNRIRQYIINNPVNWESNEDFIL